MVVITVESYKNARVHTITVGNRKLFWVKMIDAQNGLGIKTMPDLVRRELCGNFETKDLTEEQKSKYIRTKCTIVNMLKMILWKK